jgi:iron complex transport system ATP-binding protein
VRGFSVLTIMKGTWMHPGSREQTDSPETPERAVAAHVPPVAARHVSATYEEGARALDGASLEVGAGELVAVVGANGAGKSTLLRVLSGAMVPSAGEVTLFGEPIQSLDRRAIARSLAVVPQAEHVAFAFSVRDVVRMGRAPHLSGWLRLSAEDEGIVDDVIERCDLARLQHRPAAALSGGERKRVAIARALAQRPRVLLLDEPGAYLDVRHGLALYDLLAEEIERASLACMVVMHDLNIAAQYASRIALMKDGKLVACGAVEDVMTYENLRRTFETDLYAGVNELTGARFFLPMRASMRRS